MSSISLASPAFGIATLASHQVQHESAVNGKLVAFSADDPGCGTPPPGLHPPRPHGAQVPVSSSALDEVALNPQPLPPRERFGSSLPIFHSLLSHGSRFAAAALNPQPLPPRADGPGIQPAGRLIADEQCGSVPRWFHHLPPAPPPVGFNDDPLSRRGIIIVGG